MKPRIEWERFEYDLKNAHVKRIREIVFWDDWEEELAAMEDEEEIEDFSG